jgi:hypothetical protein
MPRKSVALSKSTPATAKSRKRQLSASTPIATPGTRSSKRIKDSTEKERSLGKATPTKSKYFQESDSESDDNDPAIDVDEESGYGDEDVSEEEDDGSDEAESEDEYDLENSAKTRGRKPAKGVKTNGGAVKGVQSAINAVLEKGSELWREGVRTGLGPGKQVIIAKPKARTDGGIAYVPGRIHPNTMAFVSLHIRCCSRKQRPHLDYEGTEFKWSRIWIAP